MTLREAREALRKALECEVYSSGRGAFASLPVGWHRGTIDYLIDAPIPRIIVTCAEVRALVELADTEILSSCFE